MVRRLAICCLALSACFSDASPNPNETGETGTSGTGEPTGLVTGISASASATTSGTSSSTGSSGSTTESNDSTGGTGSTSGSTATHDSSSSTAAATEGSSSESSGDSSTGDGILQASELVEGDLVITEIMGDPTCTGDNCEWFEVYNATEFPISLVGLGIGDRSDAPLPDVDGQVLADVVVEPGGLAVLVKQPLDWPYDAEYAGAYGPNPSLNNNTPERLYIFTPDGEILDESPLFINEPADQGRSLSLRPEFWDADNSNGDNWCHSNDELASSAGSEWGTPGSAAVNCVP